MSRSKAIVGDSGRRDHDYDLVLLCGDNLSMYGTRKPSIQADSGITIQFSPDLFSDTLLPRSQSTSIRKMPDRAQKLSFPLHAVKESLFDNRLFVKVENRDFISSEILKVLYELSICDDVARCRAVLSRDPRLRRIVVSTKSGGVYQFYTIRRNQILSQLAELLLDMTPVSFSRFSN